MSVILGLNFFHMDTSACLVADGVLKSVVAQERLGRRLKHDPSFPADSIRHVLAESGVRLADVTHVAVAGDPRCNYRAKVGYVLRRPWHSAGAVVEHFRRRRRSDDLVSRLAEICECDPSEARFEVVRVEHHLAHIASAYYLSPFDGLTAGFSFDASGDFVSAMAARCEGTKIEVLDRVYLPHSLGFFYTAICQFIGFEEFGEEYKAMGLSGYGQDSYRDLMARLLTFDDSHWFRLNRPYFGMHAGGESGVLDERNRVVIGRLYTGRLLGELGAPRRPSEPITAREEDLARSCQVRFEEALIHCARRLHRLVPTDRIAYAGGCALNGVANARLLRETPFSTPYLQCAASDDGTCLGAAYYCYHNVVGGTERFHLEHGYWGPQYAESRLKQAAQSCRMPLRRFEDATLSSAVARLLGGGLVVGWFQGRSEWGPRALGNRCILADPTRPDMQATINAKIKRRERFRPFAPTVLREHVGTYFEQDVSSPFMMHVVKIRPEWRDKLPAVTHVDGTGRLQSIERHQNPRYYDLIEAFAEHSGVRAVLNTSFNENEPIVDTPEQAVDCFTRTDLDALCLGNYVVCKPRHAERLTAETEIRRGGTQKTQRD